MTGLALAVFFELAAGALLPGPAEGGARFRHAEAVCSLTPAVVKPGETAVLRVRLTPRAGARWHEADLLPSRVEILPAAGWTAEVTELPLPLPEAPEAPREFTLQLRAGGDAVESGALVLRIRYGVRLPRGQEDDRPASAKTGAAAPQGDAEGQTGPADAAAERRSREAVPPEVVFENVTLTVGLPPLALPAIESEGKRAPARGPSRPESTAETTGAPPPGGTGSLADFDEPAREPYDQRGSPLLPALAMALATALVFVGLAAWLRGKRRGG